MGFVGSIRGAVRDRTAITVPRSTRSSSSLLPTAFNECLAEALRFRDDGTCTHIAMCHSDISCEPGWLDSLWGELWFHGAAFVSAIVPLKNMQGLTSTAIGVEGDRWKVKRCLTLAECKKLPLTFGPEAVCGPGDVLLVNSGCWLSDLRHPMWDEFITPRDDGTSGFNLHSRLLKHAPGFYTVETRSEDWELSHFMHDQRVRYLATRVVRLKHAGNYEWANY